MLRAAAAAVPAVAMPRLVPAQTPVDMALLLLVDASASISDRMLRFQLSGHSAALRQQTVVDAMVGGPVGRIAISTAAFSDPGRLTVLVPWRLIETPEAAVDLADELAQHAEEAGEVPSGATAIGSALFGSLGLFRELPFEPARKVVDLSGNGFSNAGPPPESAHPALNQAEIVVNGLAILNEFPWLVNYFTERVITGPGAFVREVLTAEDYSTSLAQKLVREIV